jgi:hypothetical protein
VDFCSKVLSQTHQLSKSKAGALSVNQELELAIADLYVLSKQLPNPAKSVSETQDEQTLRLLAVSCSEICVEISIKLNRFKVVRGKYKMAQFLVSHKIGVVGEPVTRVESAPLNV